MKIEAQSPCIPRNTKQNSVSDKRTLASHFLLKNFILEIRQKAFLGCFGRFKPVFPISERVQIVVVFSKLYKHQNTTVSMFASQKDFSRSLYQSQYA